MLNSLNIKNFRNLKDLKIRSLGQVNLFTGRNNTGKSTILEAISIYASQGDINSIYEILEDRGESFRQSKEISKNITDINLKAFSSLFTNRQTSYLSDDALVIGAMENTLFGEQVSTQQFISLRFVRYNDEIVPEIENDYSTGIRRRVILEDDIDDYLSDYNVGLEVKVKENSIIVSLERDRISRLSARSIGKSENFQYIRIKNIDRELNGKLWDNITLSIKESYVLDALRIIEPEVERINFIEGNGKRTPVIKLKNNNSVFPLKSMGDGINRILTVILGLVNSDNGYLLLDEFENGLHYSVQEKLWKIIFNLVQKLSIQVFATTHSEDCISGFEKVLNAPENHEYGKLIRLDFINEMVKQVEFTAEELKIANEQDIEIR